MILFKNYKIFNESRFVITKEQTDLINNSASRWFLSVDRSIEYFTAWELVLSNSAGWSSIVSRS